MAQATKADGSLQELTKCRIITPFAAPDDVIRLKILPDLSMSKSSEYQSENIPGRSSPVVTYSHSSAKMITSELHFMTTTCQDIIDNLRYLRLLESLTYPGAAAGGAPFIPPPPVCKFICGKLLGDSGQCVVLKSWSFRADPSVAWDVETYLPYKFSVSCQWECVYSCANLPTNSMIRGIGAGWQCPPRSQDTTPTY